ncbi:MAG: quinate 5-dehydrogenase [Bacillota bacterium]|nr:quinate 5-dehydrogenase [Bacillota bacterium]
MKRVVGVSLGSSKRNKTVVVEYLGQTLSVERIGVDGDIKRAVDLIKELDGKVEAFGMGGIDLWIRSRTKDYLLQAAVPIAEAPKATPMVDGGGLKHILERRLIEQLDSTGTVDFKGKHVFIVSAMSHFGFADALTARGCDLALGDLAFALGVPIMIRSADTLDFLAKFIAPVACRLPLSMLYPTGEKQEKNEPKFVKWYEWADIVTGDFHFIKKHMPVDMRGKIIMTNTITDDDVKLLTERGISLLATVTPEMDGRSFGVNVMEAMLLALSGKGKQVTPKDYEELVERLDMKPRIQWLNR